MVSKDQAIGGAILLVCTVLAVVYLAALFFYEQIIGVLPWLKIADVAAVHYWLIALPVMIALVAILAIGAWIGWTMATTPPPKPIEEITTEIEDKKEAEPAVMPEETVVSTGDNLTAKKKK
ncbi:MAG: hypothetical protein LBQ98_08585 [Nitrososphaerota archaeon]|jgi:predicted DNA-binding transcriptional regulator|nr:hypothetical protein [Nitrososphaerota archaeon]